MRLGRGGRDRGAADRAEHRRRHRRWPTRVGVMVNGRIDRIDAGRASWRPTASCSSGCSASAGTATRTTAPAAGAEPTPRRPQVHRCAAPRRRSRVYMSNPTPADALVAAGRRRRRSRPRRAPLAPRAPRRRRRSPQPAPAGRRLPVAASSEPRVATSPAPSTPRATSCASCATCLEQPACACVTVDLSTSRQAVGRRRAPARGGAPPSARRSAAVFTGDRGTAVAGDGAGVRALGSRAQARHRRHHLGRRLGRHRAGRRRPCARCRSACPKVMVSTVASRRRAALRRPDRHLHDVLGHRRAGPQPRSPSKVLANAAHALAGMVARARRPRPATRGQARASGSRCSASPRPACRQVTAALEDDYDCLVFHATGIGGQSMEKLVDSRPARRRDRRHHHRGRRR